MRKRPSSLLAVLAATGLFVLACQAPAPAAPGAPAESAVAVEPEQAEPAVPPAATAAIAQATEPAAPAQATSPVSETQAVEPPDPIAPDPNRPGLTMDGSPSLGDPAAPIVIVDFSDFQ